MPEYITRYNWQWPPDFTDLEIEFQAIRFNGYWRPSKDAQWSGAGLFHHYKRAQELLWPQGEDHHRWSDLILKTILENRVTAIQGARDSGKTHCMSRYAITDYFVFPEETLILISSTDLRGLQLRVWGDIKDLWQRAKDVYDWLPGNPVDSKHGIFTDSIGEEASIRDIRKGIICIPCLGSNGEWVGMEKFYGVKQKRRRLLGDEVSMMRQPYINTLANLDKGDFKGVFVGNPLGRGDPLDRFSEPTIGWNAQPEPTKTTTWKNKFGGITITLVGTDSPNFDYPPEQPTRYPYLIDRKDEVNVRTRYGENSLQYWSQIKGVRKAGLDMFRVLTREICERYGAFKEAIWKGTPLTQVYALDAAFGGDRAVAGKIEFGANVDGQQIIKCYEPEEIHVQLGTGRTVEEQLSEHVSKRCNLFGIPARNVFFDAGMYATLATAMSKAIGTEVNAVNFQGPATNRPMAADEFVFDKTTNTRRLKLCNEAYSKFVTELWWSVRLIVESGQMREIPEEVVEEFSMREWTKVSGDRYELESKRDMKERIGYSPDYADWCAIACEGARRLGFSIVKMVNIEAQEQSQAWIEAMLKKARAFRHKRELNYKA